MTARWIVKDAEGQLLPQLSGNSLLEVGRKVVPTHYDAFRLHVSASYRELFDRALMLILQREAWQIVPVKANTGWRSQVAKDRKKVAFKAH